MISKLITPDHNFFKAPKINFHSNFNYNFLFLHVQMQIYASIKY